eukprot:08579_6
MDLLADLRVDHHIHLLCAERTYEVVELRDLLHLHQRCIEGVIHHLLQVKHRRA